MITIQKILQLILRELWILLVCSWKFRSNSLDLARAENANNRVLVHCAMGISRSSAIVLAWMMQTNGWSFEKSRDFVKAKRPVIKPNEGFLQQLKEFDVY